MNKIDAFKDYLIFIEGESADSDINSAVNDLECLLGNAKAVRLRLAYLRSLLGMSGEFDKSGDSSGEGVRLIPNPLDDLELKAILDLGLVQAHSRGLVKTEKLFQLAHSLEGLESFAMALALTDPSVNASYFNESANEQLVPFDHEGSKTASSPRISYLLYVDDVKAEAEAVTEIMRSKFESGYRVRGFTSPGAALEYVKDRKSRGFEVAAVVTDMYMPEEFHGDELAQRLHLVDPAIPVLGYSGHNQFQDPEQAKKSGLVDLLPKQSTDSLVLVEMVESILRKRTA
jgi:CheY-like chemotaxis protein